MSKKRSRSDTGSGSPPLLTDLNNPMNAVIYQDETGADYPPVQCVTSTSTQQSICSVARKNFAQVIIEYLKSKSRKSNNSSKVITDVFKRQITLNNTNKSIRSISDSCRSSSPKTVQIKSEDKWWLENYWETYLTYITARLGLDIDLKNKLNEYWTNSSRYEQGSVIEDPDYDRKEIFDFFDETLMSKMPPEQKFKTKNEFRFTISGKQLMQATQDATNMQPDAVTYISDAFQNNEDAVLCTPAEIAGIKKVLKGRHDRNVNKKDGSGGYGTMMFFTEDSPNKKYTISDKSTQLNDTYKKKVYEKIIEPNFSGEIDKQVAGECWICKKPMYHYSCNLDDKLEDTIGYIYLNNKSGEDEHVFPPTLGDIIGTLNLSKKQIDITRAENPGEPLLYDYGIRPAHELCNRIKSDFLLSGFILCDQKAIKKRDTIIDFIEAEWKAQVKGWFDSQKNNSFEWVFSEKGHYKFANTEDYSAEQYSTATLSNMQTFINTNIVDFVNEQSVAAESSIENLLKLKLIIYGIDLCKSQSEAFKKVWDAGRSPPSADTYNSPSRKNRRSRTNGGRKTRRKTRKKNRK